MWLHRSSRAPAVAGVPLVLLFWDSAQVSVRASDGDPEAGAEPEAHHVAHGLRACP